MLSLRQITGGLPAANPKIKSWPIKRTKLKPTTNLFLETALYGIGRSFLSGYMRLMLNADIQRHAMLPEGPKILAANHPSSIDPFYILTLLSEPVSVLITAAAFDVPIFGAYLHAAGHIPAVRSSGGSTVEAVVRRVEAGRSVVIFPEGALSPLGGGYQRPHSGVARVALHTGAPVIPVGIGLQQEHLRVTKTSKDGENVIGHLYTSGPYAMTVGQPLYFEDDVLDRERVRSVAGQIMHHIRNLAYESECRISPAQGVEAATMPAQG